MNIRKVLNKLNELDFNIAKDRHTFGELYETILKDLQSAGKSGEFYTPRAITQFLTEMITPQIGEKVLDLSVGTGGVSICIAAELAGHSRLETTQKHYTSTDNAAVVQDATAKINAANDARIDQWPDTIE